MSWPCIRNKIKFNAKPKHFRFQEFRRHLQSFSKFSMETEFELMKSMEEEETNDFQQCSNVEIIEVPDSPSPVDMAMVNISDSLKEDDDVECINDVQEEPIDLTFDRPVWGENYDIENMPKSNAKRIIIQSKPRQFDIEKAEILFKPNESSMSENIPMTGNDTFACNWNQIPNSSSQRQPLPEKVNGYSYAIVRPESDLYDQLTARQQEVLRMAKSMFSKRTRTLYHWMYPTASKQQIKQIVASTWDSMGAPDKNIYIAQVLGKYGCNKPNLMVNPQLGQIKELPPVPGIQKFNSKASELQNAISSISCDTGNIQSCYPNQPPKKKKKITSKKMLAQNMSNACQEFGDDPELSQELAQFSIMLKNQF